MSRTRRHRTASRHRRRQRGGGPFGYASTGEFGKAAFENADTSKGYLIPNKSALVGGGHRRRHRHQRDGVTRRHRRRH